MLNAHRLGRSRNWNVNYNLYRIMYQLHFYIRRESDDIDDLCATLTGQDVVMESVYKLYKCEELQFIGYTCQRR